VKRSKIIQAHIRAEEKTKEEKIGSIEDMPYKKIAIE